MKTEQNFSILALRSHCSGVKTELFENANGKTARFENDPFSGWTPKTETFEKASHSFPLFIGC